MGADRQRQSEVVTTPRRVVGRPFPKGVSGNPKGRPPKVKTITEAIRGLVDPQEIARALVKAARHNPRLMMYLIDRLEGTPVQTQMHGEVKDIPVILGWSPPGTNGAKDGDGS